MKSALALFLFLAVAAGGALAETPASRVEAQQQQAITQPGNNAPVWREVRSGENHYSSLPGREMGVLIQSSGETWRRVRNGPVTFYGGWLLVVVLALIAAVYLGKGPVKLSERPTGRLIPRFSITERVVHWSTAISFCILGLSGLIMLFGKHVLLPIFGYTLFGWLTLISKNLHNFIAPLFIVSVLAMIVLFLRDNWPRAYDWAWFKGAWGFFMRGKHIPSGRFNGGEKGWFWIGVVALSVAVSWSGVILLFPNFDQTRAVMQEAWIWHSSAAIVYIAISLGHIYMGTIGVEGSYQAMRTGSVDETWAREHHEYWYNDVKSGKHAAGGAALPRAKPAQEAL